MTEIALHIERRGTGAPPLVFVHGYLCDHSDWRHQTAHFEATRETIAVDLRGMGASPRGDAPMTPETLGQDVADLLGELDLAGAVLVGHSMGVRVAVEAAARVPERVAGLVLIESARIHGGAEGAVAMYRRLLDERGNEEMVRRSFRNFFLGPVPEWGEERIDRAAAVPEDTAAPLILNVMGHDERFTAAMREVTVPMLLIQSTGRTATGGFRSIEPDERTTLQDLAEQCGVTYDIFRHIGPGHFNMIEDPEPVNARIERFLAERVERRVGTAPRTRTHRHWTEGRKGS